ncbi:Pc13g05930 [Penicillium rubens Wisconsin 54-1255]|uniref:Pc13g05930 protein n=1 Tax=Penicillium rubens (strain ATCC 28089 / DSM 1075 / NRRL 1951 / Wisconsin 54-1255) TaxID=500485 RepID=B6H381_PENRW|nr:Pc13g05930 [Penicillium rubens Wisconsin 54-1255]
MFEIVDDKSQHCIPFLLDRLRVHTERHRGNPNTPPFFIGLNGVQGAGKTVLVSALNDTLRSEPYSLSVVTLSLDDIYLDHANQVALAQAHPSNPLLQHRGQPSTHDLALGEEVFASLAAERPTAIPQYDKSAFEGQGDRVPKTQWNVVNEAGQEKVKVVIFEGWCVGFRAWDDQTLRAKWEAALDALIHMYELFYHLTYFLSLTNFSDAENPRFVYEWRQEQERTLRAAKGVGMTEEQVNHFVDGYYPSYELFTETLREGAFKPTPHNPSASNPDWQGRQLRLVINRDRRVQKVVRI